MDRTKTIGITCDMMIGFMEASQILATHDYLEVLLLGFLSVGWMLSVATGGVAPNVEEYYRNEHRGRNPCRLDDITLNLLILLHGLSTTLDFSIPRTRLRSYRPRANEVTIM
jgi:hypothetical protein